MAIAGSRSGSGTSQPWDPGSMDSPTGTTIRPFVVSDAAAVSSLIARCLVEVNSRDYHSSIIARMVGHFTPETVIEMSFP